MTRAVIALVIVARAVSAAEGPAVRAVLSPARTRRPAPEFALKDSSRKAVKLKHYRGKVLVPRLPRTTSLRENASRLPFSATAGQHAPSEAISKRHVRAYGAVADCCKAAPSVLEFDSDGKLLRAWGGPSDPGFIGGKCKTDAGCIWPNSEHGIYVDQNDNVWLSGSAAAPAGQASHSQLA